MKNVFKVLGIIALIAVISFGLVSCGGDDDGGGGAKNELSGTVTVGATESILFEYRISSSGDQPGTTITICTFTTDLPAPNNSFTVSDGDQKDISNLTVGQKVNWTAKIAEGGSLEKRDDPNVDVSLRGRGK